MNPASAIQPSGGPLDLDLNRLGADGWELAAIDAPGESSVSRYIFKRRKQ
jgi:hypothetical protein